MAPLGKDAMTHGIDGLDMVTFRVTGGALLFWITSFFTKKEHVPRRDLLRFVGAGALGIIANQCCYIIGLSITSPINASIVTTSMPIFALILSAIILKEPITGRKSLGVMMGCSGALILILTSAQAASSKVGDIRGDLMCLGAQFSYALYVVFFNPLVKKYSTVTVNKWMFLFAALLIDPFSFSHVADIQWSSVPMSTWWETAYVVGIGTYLAYILTIIGQRTLRPTVVSIYNYVQPCVSVVVSVLAGLGVFKWSHAIAIILVFSGVRLVSKHKKVRAK